VLQTVLFLVAALALVLLIHYYLWRRLVRNTTRPGGVRRAGTWILVGLSMLLVVTLVGDRVLARPVIMAVSWVGYLWLALLFYLLVTLAVLEIPALVARLVLRRRAGREPADRVDVVDATVAAEVGPAPTTDPGAAQPSPHQPGVGRRLVLARAVAITAGVASAGIVASGVRSAIGPPQLKRVQVALAKLPRSTDGFRIALVSDIHLGPLSGVGRTRRIVDIINGLDADLVAIVGDLVDGSVAELGPQAEPLRDLRSRLGSFFVTGNHEYYSGYREWVAEVASFGVRPLRNERLELPGGLDLAGVNDATGVSYGDAADYDKALGGRDPARPVVLLAHQPIQAHEAATRGVDLQLSGHTHGGQMAPFNLVVKLTGQPVVSGLGQVDGMPVYVTNGAGFWGPPVRVGAPPDVTLVELRAS
jgi:uncharacterized protein